VFKQLGISRVVLISMELEISNRLNVNVKGQFSDFTGIYFPQLMTMTINGNSHTPLSLLTERAITRHIITSSVWKLGASSESRRLLVDRLRE
jgi:hypothetical protein